MKTKDSRTDQYFFTFLYSMGVAGGIFIGATLAQAQTAGTVNPAKPQYTTTQGGQNNFCVGLVAPGVETIVVDDNRGAYSIYDWDATAWGHIDMQDNDPPLSVHVGPRGKVTVTNPPMTNLEVRVYTGDQTTMCAKGPAGGIAGCALVADEHYTMLPGSTSPYPWNQVAILPNGLEYEAIKVTVTVDRPATCVGSHYLTLEHANP